MAYITTEELRTYLKISSVSDDTLMTKLIAAAQKRIDQICHRTFETGTDDTVRYFDFYRDVRGRTVYFDTDLTSITTLEIDDETIPSTDYVLEPRNIQPAWGMTLRNYLGWSGSSNFPEYRIKINGKWGYSQTAPEPVKQACRRLAGFYYREKGAQVFETLGNDKTGPMQLPASEPGSVMKALIPYIRRYHRPRY